MWMTIFRGVMAGLVVVGVTELADRSPRMGALLLTLPLVSMLAFIMAWTKHSDMAMIAILAKETLVLVPLGLVFFLPLAFYDRVGLSFWSAFLAGVILAGVSIALWFRFGPRIA